MTKSEAGKLGFQALVDKRFDGDRSAAARYVADLGRASYFYNLRWRESEYLLKKYEGRFPGITERLLKRWEVVF